MGLRLSTLIGCLASDFMWTPSFVTTDVTWNEVSATAANCSVATLGRHALLKDGAADAASEVLVKIRSASVPPANFGGGIILRAAGAAGSETGVIFCLNSGVNSVTVGTYSAGSFDGQVTATFAWALNTWYWMRLRVNGSTVNARIWAEGDVEPGAWTITTTTTVTAAGGLGLFNFRDGPHNYAGFAYALAGASVPVPTNIAANDHAANVIYQQAAGVAPVGLSGTYRDAAPATIEVQLYAADGTTVLQAWAPLTGTTIGSGTWSGTLSANAGGMYRFVVRSKRADGTVLAMGAVSTNLWGVGSLIALIGSSSADYWAGAAPAISANADIRRAMADGSWDVSPAVGINIVANALNTAAGWPVGYIGLGASGSTLAQWSDSANSTYVNALSRLNGIGGKLSAALVTVGSNDVVNGTVTSKAAHLAQYQQLLSNLRTDLGQSDLPVFISGSNRRPTNTQHEAFTWIREAEKDLAAVANTYYAAQTIDLEMSGDNVHLTTAGFQSCLDRLRMWVVGVLEGGAINTSPNIASITYTGSTITVTITHGTGTDIAPATGITGFTASDNSGALTISSAVRGSATTVTLTVDRAVTAPLTVRYLYGADPIGSGGGVKDNTALAIPMNIETELAVT